MGLFLIELKVENFVVLGLPLLLYASFPFLTFVLLTVSYTLYLFIKCDKSKHFTLHKQIFSLQNISIALSQGTILYLYFIGNIFQKNRLKLV